MPVHSDAAVRAGARNAARKRAGGWQVWLGDDLAWPWDGDRKRLYRLTGLGWARGRRIVGNVKRGRK